MFNLQKTLPLPGIQAQARRPMSPGIKSTTGQARELTLELKPTQVFHQSILAKQPVQP